MVLCVGVWFFVDVVDVGGFGGLECGFDVVGFDGDVVDIVVVFVEEF